MIVQSVSPEANAGRATADLNPPAVSTVQPTRGVRRPQRALLNPRCTNVNDRPKGVGPSLIELTTNIAIMQMCPTICVLASQVTPAQSLNIYSINANGMGSVLKVNTISNNINRRDPSRIRYIRDKIHIKAVGQTPVAQSEI